MYSLLCCSIIPFSCNEVYEEEQIARYYCGSCHLFPEPSLLDKATWQKNVLPVMGKKLGVSVYNGEYYIDMAGRARDSGAQAAISIGNWQTLVQYYLANAPEKMPPQNRPPVKNITGRFAAKQVIFGDKSPSISYVKIDPGNRRIYAANVYDSLFAVFDPQLRLLNKQNIHSVAVDLFFDEDIHLPGERNGVLTNIGILHPNDVQTGTLESFSMDATGMLALDKTIWSKIPRPVQASAADFDQDGKTDYLVCGFGNNNGSFFYIRNKGNNEFEQKMLKALPGATRAYIDDYNKDGFPDIIALMAQGDEGIFLFQNKGDGNFDIKELLRFPPIYGSSYFEMTDVNADGLKDIIYTSGDNIDLSPVLKNYHGIYVFVNKGNQKFEQEVFFPLNGCYKAVARDFDKDGDMDIAAISYFPDFINQPQESFVYLENKGGFQFSPFTIKEFDKGRWIVMDAGDADGDGDDDIILGSMILTNNGGEPEAAGVKQKPSFLLLVNKTK